MPNSLVPVTPEGVSIDANMRHVRTQFGRIVGPIDYHWFYEQVRNRGPWDFKQRGDFEEFGNFHYGAVGYAGGIPESILLRGAGCAQMRAGTSLPEWSSCWSEPPYGDDPRDQYWIERGIEYAKSQGY